MNDVVIAIAFIIVFVAGYLVGSGEERKRMLKMMKRENLTIRKRK